MAKKAVHWLPLVVTLVLLGGTLAYAQSTIINTCYNTKTGAMRYLTAGQTCAKGVQLKSDGAGWYSIP